MQDSQCQIGWQVATQIDWNHFQMRFPDWSGLCFDWNSFLFLSGHLVISLNFPVNAAEA